MTGRDLIIYILQNHLEDEELFVDGTIPGYVTLDEAAILADVGRSTVDIWIKLCGLRTVRIGDQYFIKQADLMPFIRMTSDKTIDDLYAEYLKRMKGEKQ